MSATTSAHPGRVAKRTPRAPVQTPLVSIPRPTSNQLTAALDVVRATTWVADVTAFLPQRAAGSGGRTRTLPVEAFFVGALCLALMTRPFHIRDIAHLLNEGLDQNTRRRLGIPKKMTVTERKVSYLFNQVIAAIDRSCYSSANEWLFDKNAVREHLDLPRGHKLDRHDLALVANQHLDAKAKAFSSFVRSGLRATHPANAPHAGDYAMDATYVDSWERPKSRIRRTKTRNKNGTWAKRKVTPWLYVDPDARWWSKRGAGEGRLSGVADSGLGYAVTAITRIGEDLGPGAKEPVIPHLIEHISVRGEHGPMWLEGSNTLREMVAFHENEDQEAGRDHRQRGDILADREYTRVSQWQKHAHQLGFTPHFNLAKEQQGKTATLASGVVIIDGLPYSPGIPTALTTTTNVPGFLASQKSRALADAFYRQRAPYRLKTIGGARQDNGALKLYCPASTLAKHAISCANKPASQNPALRPGRITIGTALPVINTAPKPAVCEQSTVTVPFDDVPFWQPHIPYTVEHDHSMGRRNQVESSYARIKDPATQSVRRGNFRVVGITKVSFVILLAAMAANILEVARWKERMRRQHNHHQSTHNQAPIKRVPRKLTIKREQERLRREQLQARRDAELTGVPSRT